MASDNDDIVAQTYGELIQQKNFERNVDISEINDWILKLLETSMEKIFT